GRDPPSAREGRTVKVSCPHCRSSFESAEDVEGEVLCPTCGSSFGLDQERTLSHVIEHRRLGKFDMIEPVGSGAFGMVWRARDTALGRIVAVKIPRGGQLTSEKEAQRFVREARSAAQLRHPGIVTIHEVGRFESLPFIVADFVRGVTLAEYL